MYDINKDDKMSFRHVIIISIMENSDQTSTDKRYELKQRTGFLTINVF